MERRLLSIVAFILFSIILSSTNTMAITTDLHPSYESRETAIVKLSGNILEPIDSKQIAFLRGHVEVPFIYDFKNLNGSYYLWAIMPQTKGNYTLRIKDIATTVSGENKKINFEQNFSVDGNMTNYNIEPGFVVVNGDFNMDVNLFEDFDRIISLDYPIRKDITIKPGKNIVNFPFDDSGGTELIIIHLGKYSIPVYIMSNNPPRVIKGPIVLIPIRIENVHLISEKNIFYSFEISNSLERELTDIQISYNKDVFSIVPQTKSINLAPRERAQFNITLKKNLREGIYEQILIQSEKDNISLSLPVYINFTENISELIVLRNLTERNLSIKDNGSKVSITERFYCSELGGKLCLSDEKCDGKETESLDGKCCIGSCAIEAGGSKWVGYLIAAIALLILIYIYYKYRKAKPGASILEKKMTLPLSSEKKIP
ncbi:hypothetical protein HYW75_03265 [Candidatus Pacearchaeota archaeon]|nr:hypothetical protein [Candidatus Pacearchaeota archaeon]